MNKTAHLSPDFLYRYSLGREWDLDKPCITYIMLNPSTADALKDDATIRKCIGFAERLGFGSIKVVNLFSFRSRDPYELRARGYPGKEAMDNLHLQQVLVQTLCSGGTVCCAWGSNARDPVIGRRAKEIMNLLKELQIRPKALRILADGIPSHPLMLSYTNTLQDYHG